MGARAEHRGGLAKPVWLLRTRAAGSLEWVDRLVEARSALQAEAILRRLGLDVDIESARRVDDPPDDLAAFWPMPGPLLCNRCAYELNGLLVKDAVVTCPECGYGQVVLAFAPGVGADAATQARGVRPPTGATLALRVVVVLLAIVGGIVVFLFALAFSASVFGY